MAEPINKLSPLPVPPNRKSDSQDEFDRKVPLSLDAQVKMVQELNADTIPKLNAISTVSNTILPHLDNIGTVAGIASEVVTTSAMKDNIAEIVRNKTNINTVAGISGDVTKVANIDTDVTTLVPSLAEVTTVASIVTDVVAVSSVKEAVTIDALHINNIDAVGARAAEVDELAKRTEKIDTLYDKVDVIDTNALHIRNIDAVGNHIGAVLNADANMNAITEAPAHASTASIQATEATRQAELAKQYADSASAVSGLPEGKPENDQQPVIWDKDLSLFVFGTPTGANYVQAPGIAIAPEVPIGFPTSVTLTGIAGIVGAFIQSFSTKINDEQIIEFQAVDNSYTDTITPQGNPGEQLKYTATATDSQGYTSLVNQRLATLVKAVVSKPSVTSPFANAIVSNQTIQISGSPFLTVHLADTHKASRWKITTDAAGNNIIHDSGWRQDALTSYTAVVEPVAPANCDLFVFVQHQGIKIGDSEWSEPIQVKSSYVLTPVVVSPIPSSLVGSQTMTITSNAFSTFGGNFDTHEATRWKVTTDAAGNNALYDSGWNSQFLTQVEAVMNPIVSPATALYLWVQFKGVTLGESARSKGIQVQTGSVTAPSIVAPADDAIVPLSGFVVTGSAFKPITGSVDTMVALYCQVATDPEFVTIIYDSGRVATTSTTHEVLFTGEKPGQNAALYVRMRYEGDILGISVYSETQKVVTTATKTVSVTSPVNGASDVDIQPTIVMTGYADTGSFDSGVKTQVQLSSVVNFSTLVYDSGEITYTTSHKVTKILSVDMPLFCRVRHFGNAIGATDWSTTVAFRTFFGIVTAPTITLPSYGSVIAPTNITISTSAFKVTTGATDTHISSRFQILNTGNGVIYDSGEIGAVTSHTAANPNVSRGATYQARAMHKGAKLGLSNWSNNNRFSIINDRHGERLGGMATIIGLGPGQPFTINGVKMWIAVIDAKYRSDYNTPVEFGVRDIKDSSLPFTFIGSHRIEENTTESEIDNVFLHREIHSSKENCDVWMQYVDHVGYDKIKGVPVVEMCRKITLQGKKCDCPSIKVLARIFQKKDFIDKNDPTIALYPYRKLSNWGFGRSSDPGSKDNVWSSSNGGDAPGNDSTSIHAIHKNKITNSISRVSDIIPTKPMAGVLPILEIPV